METTRKATRWTANALIAARKRSLQVVIQLQQRMDSWKKTISRMESELSSSFKHGKQRVQDAERKYDSLNKKHEKKKKKHGESPETAQKIRELLHVRARGGGHRHMLSRAH